MNHPSREEWMSYLYDELEATAKSNLAAHWRACAECRAAVDEWRSARRQLDAWQLAPRSRWRPAGPAVFAPLWKWAGAAAVFALAVGLGFGFGRAAAANHSTALESEVRKQVEAARVDLRRELTQTLRAELETKLAADREAVYAALKQLNTQRLADYLALKKDVDTVAVLTDAGLRRAQQELVQLADYTMPGSSPEK